MSVRPGLWDLWVCFLIRSGNLLESASKRTVAAYRHLLSNSELMQYLVCALSLPILILVHRTLQWVPAFQLAYVLPVGWVSRKHGTQGGLFMSGLAVIAGFMADRHHPDLILPTILLSGTIRFMIFASVVFIVTSQERKFRVASETAHRDHLTGALNRLGFIVAGQFAVQSAIQRHTSATVAVIDLNSFKQLNDQYGHDFGDRILHQLVKALQRHLPDNAVIGRLGGDEFAVVIPDTLHEQAEIWLRQARDRFSDITLVLGRRSTFSYGLVEVPQYAATLESALSDADRRMYMHKQLSAVGS